MKYHEMFELRNIYFEGLVEPSKNSLRLYFSRSFTSSTPDSIEVSGKQIENLYSINVNEELPIIQIDFETYISYSIRNESFTSWDDYEKFDGKSFRIYKKSRYLDFVRVSTFASNDYPGQFKHYGMSCLNHVIDIASISEPVVSEINRKVGIKNKLLGLFKGGTGIR